MAERAAGVIVRRGDQRGFIPADAAVSIVGRPEITRVPGTDISMALIAGRIVTVIELGEPGRELVLCDIEGQPIALSGLSVDAAGFFDLADSEAVLVGEEQVTRFDVAAELARVEQRLWSGREPA